MGDEVLTEFNIIEFSVIDSVLMDCQTSVKTLHSAIESCGNQIPRMDWDGELLDGFQILERVREHLK
jgi:hypothetical protein